MFLSHLLKSHFPQKVKGAFSKFGGLFFLSAALCGCHTIKLAHNNPQEIPSYDPPEKPVKVALVLGGGGSKGLAHVGVIHELEQVGIHPDLIVGCSSGALIGALYADNPDTKRLEALLLNLKRSDLIDFSLLASRFGFVRGTSLERFLFTHLRARHFGELQIPLIVVSADLISGELIEFGKGPLVPALRASAAVPGVFNPVEYLGRYLVDGGVVNPIPVEIAKKCGAEVVIAVDVGEDLSREGPSHVIGVVRRGLAITHRTLADHVTRDADVLIRMDFQDLGMFSDQYNSQIYERGRQMTRAMLPAIKRVVEKRLAPPQETRAPSWLLMD